MNEFLINTLIVFYITKGIIELRIINLIILYFKWIDFYSVCLSEVENGNHDNIYHYILQI